MTHRGFTLRLAPFLVAFACAAGAIQPEVDRLALDRVVQESRRNFEAPGIAVAVVKNGEVVYLRAFGQREVGKEEPVTPDTRFAIGSSTKAFTTAVLSTLVEEGKLSWDDPVQKHLPGFRLSDPLANENVTIRDLVCHRTGLSRNDALWYWTEYSREEILRRIGLVPLTKPFRSTYQYQNIMFLAAGELAGRVGGTSWESLVQVRILEPLGMTNTDFTVRQVVLSGDHATPHARRKEKIEVIPWRNIDNIGPAGSINSSARDMARWVQMLLNDGKFQERQILAKAQLEEMWQAQMVVREEGRSRELNPDTNLSAYGLGWRLQDYRGLHMISHGGAIDGFRAQVALLPRQKLGIVILTNLGGNNMPEALRFRMVDVLEKLPPKDWDSLYLATAKKQEQESLKRRLETDAKRFRDTKPSRELAAYAGEYEHSAYGRVLVTADPDGLRLQWQKVRLQLSHFHFDTFRSAEDGNPLERTTVHFQLDETGQPAAVRFLDQNFIRVVPKPAAGALPKAA